MGTETALQVVNPIACVFLVRGNPVHDSLAVTFVVFPVAFIVVTCLVGHFTLTLLHALQPVALVDRAVFVTEFTVTVAHAVDPFAFILDTLFCVDIVALSVAQPIHHVTSVGAAV